MSAPRVLIIVQNLPVPLDRRVWLECQALTAAGYTVSVICPRGPQDSAHEVLDDVEIFRYAPAPQASGLAGYALEFVYSWLRTAALSVTVRRSRGFDVIQACNPPDTYWLLALVWRVLARTRFVFDHHDLNPELFLSRFGEPDGASARAQYAGLLWLERRTFAAADRVISTNASYRRIALERGQVPPEHASVVRSGPDTARMRPVEPAVDHTDGRHLLVYLGIMGPQDDVHVVLDVVSELVQVRGRSDVRAALLGFGDCLDDLRAQCTAMGLDDVVEFTGRVGPDQIADYLSAASVGLCPDRKTPLNDLSTMNKTMEYMAYAVPAVSFDLVETRVSGGDTCVYVPSGDIEAMADEVERLLDDTDERVARSLAARRRVASELDWRAQAEVYVGVFDDLTRRPSSRRAPTPPVRALGDTDTQGRAYVPLDDAGLGRFVAARGTASRADG
ncbi:MAG: glycosyltransferase family 4 protein [Cellulomonas sp.]|nr:glycosyltransferase family 4 protein [Cellulomonas sp.]